MRFRVVEDISNDLDITHSDQEYRSDRTSINSSKLPAIFKLVKFRPETVNLDYGGGRFDNATNWLRELDVTNLIYDPFNRSTEHNSFVLSEIKKNGGADTATLSNVLNVVKEENIRLEILKNIKKLLKPGSPLYITVYEGSADNNARATKAGFQLNRKTSNYIDEIKKVFNDVTQKGKLIIAR